MDTHRRLSKPSPQYTVFIRLPFPRNGFEDPEPVQWDTNKDKALWKIISKTSNSKDLNWEAMSADFGVTLTFLLQQSAWLYERHFEGMKLQMKKLGVAAGGVSASSPKPSLQDDQAATNSLPASGATSMVRTGSKDSSRGQPVASAAQYGTPPVAESGSNSATPRLNKPMVSRNPSTSTITQSRAYQAPSKHSSHRAQRLSAGSQKMPESLLRKPGFSHDDSKHALNNDEISEPEFEEGPISTRRSTAARRGYTNQKTYPGQFSSDGDAEDDGVDDDDGSGGYLPFASVAKLPNPDSAATLRTEPSRGKVDHPSSVAKHRPAEPESSTSSSDKHGDDENKRATSDRPDALSPRHRAQLEQLSPRYRRSGSEGSPSMGSSFSDLDDESVTQSALEDALLSNMQHGSLGLGIGSRMSSLREGLGRKFN